jgi:hypothetical protein
MIASSALPTMAAWRASLARSDALSQVMSTPSATKMRRLSPSSRERGTNDSAVESAATAVASMPGPMPPYHAATITAVAVRRNGAWTPAQASSSRRTIEAATAATATA